jgi:hypothetical protein
MNNFLAVLLALLLVLAAIALGTGFWIGLFAFLGWLAPETMAALQNAVGLGDIAPWQCGLIVGIVMMVVSGLRTAGQWNKD